MSGLLPQLVRSTRALPIASTSRGFVSSAVAHAKGSQSGRLKQDAKRTKAAALGSLLDDDAGASSAASRKELKTQLAVEPADLSDLVQFYPESVLPINVGKPALFPRNTYDQLQTFGLPRRLGKELSGPSPSSVIRQATLDLLGSLEGAQAAGSKDARLILSGGQGTGKSMLLVQAVSYAIEAGWVVLFDPSAIEWVNSKSQFEYNPTTRVFDQPELASKLLSKLLAVNRERLAAITLPKDVVLHSTTLTKGSKLTDLVALGIKDLRSSVAALSAAVDTLAQQTQFPVLLAVDDIQALFGPSHYRAPDYTKLEAHQLSTPRLMLDLMAGVKTLKRGAVLTATSYSDTYFMPSDSLLSGIGAETRSHITPYTELDEVALAYARSGMKRVDVPFGMSAKEAGAMFELWARKGWTSNGSDEVFLSGWTAGAGNPRELARAWRLSHYSYIV